MSLHNIVALDVAPRKGRTTVAPRGRPRDEAARVRIVTAGTELFLRDGYVATTVGGIARRAQVGVKTLYAAYGNKLGVLRAAHDRAVLGEGQPARLLDHEWIASLPQAGSAEGAWRVAVDHLAESTAQAAPILAVIHAAAADPMVRDLLADLRRQRTAFSLGLAERLLSLPGASPDASADRLADVLYAVMGTESFTLFVTERGWPEARWRSWVSDVVTRELAAPAP